MRSLKCWGVRGEALMLPRPDGGSSFAAHIAGH